MGESVEVEIRNRICSLREELAELSHAVFDAAELGFEEYLSVAAVEAMLGRSGIAVERGVGGLETAFIASVGTGASPKLAIFAEYDALPGIGHGCGHNVICAAAVGAFLGLAAVADRIEGTVLLIGSPAEENGSAKEILAEAGVLEGIDAAIMVHPCAGRESAWVTTVGLRSVEVEFHGVAAHASANPHLGRNALDAVVFAYQGVAALRQHIPQECRVHGVILEGGQVANVVPELARARFVLRADSVDGLVSLSDRVQKILEGAALMSGTTLEAEWDRVPPNLPMRSNSALAERYRVHIGNGGRAINSEGHMPGSTDMGNVSQRLPAIHPTVSIAPEMVGMHTREFTAHARGADAVQGIVESAIGLAACAADFLSDADLRDAVRAEFNASGGVIDVPNALRVK